MTTISSAISYGTDGRKRVIRRWLVGFAIGLVGIAAALLLAAGLLYWIVLGETSFKPAKANAVVSGVMNHTLAPDAVGVINLPPTLSGASCDGRAYVRVEASGTTWILIRTWQGKGGNLKGYVFCSAPPTAVPKQIRVKNFMPVAPFAEDANVDVTGTNGYGRPIIR
jgi:hypothetical protein